MRPRQCAVHHSPAHRLTSTMLPPGTVVTTVKLVPGPCRRLVLELTRAGAADARSTDPASSAAASPAEAHDLPTKIMMSSSDWATPALSRAGLRLPQPRSRQHCGMRCRG